MATDDASLNSDLSQHLSIDTGSMDWTPSPGGHVLRKRLHRVGPPESGQVTSIVQYQPGASFPGHDHPLGTPPEPVACVREPWRGPWPWQRP